MDLLGRENAADIIWVINKARTFFKSNGQNAGLGEPLQTVQMTTFFAGRVDK